jgi:hypothetical protein
MDVHWVSLLTLTVVIRRLGLHDTLKMDEFLTTTVEYRPR